MKRTAFWKLPTALLASFATAAIGNIATIPNIPTWYASLNKPPFNPPNEVFGPVWTVPYILIGISLYLLWTARHAHKRPAYGWFFAQLALNSVWSLVFFGLHLTWLGLVVIVGLLVCIVAYMVQVWHISKLAAWLMVPYLLWVSFATALNVSIALLN